MDMALLRTRRGLAACVLGLTLQPTLADEPADEPAEADGDAAPTPVAQTLDLAPSGALLLPFRPAPVGQDAGRTRIEWVMQSLDDDLNPPDLHFSSKLRMRDDSGHHNDFRLKHSGNLLHIPLAP